MPPGHNLYPEIFCSYILFTRRYGVTDGPGMHSSMISWLRRIAMFEQEAAQNRTSSLVREVVKRTSLCSSFLQAVSSTTPS